MSFFGSSSSLIGIIRLRYEQLEDSSVNTTYAITMYDERKFSAPALVIEKQMDDWKDTLRGTNWQGIENKSSYP